MNEPIHKLDARVKCSLTLAFILAISLTPSSAWPAYIIFLSAALSVAILSRAGIRYILKRSLLALPFILAAFPLVFLGSQPMIQLAFHTFVINISQTGLEKMISIGLKSWISLQAAILLTHTTPTPELLIAMRSLGIPNVFIAITGLMWRYLALIKEEANRLMLARASRSSTLPISMSRPAGGSLIWRSRVTGHMVGSLFLRALERGDRVYAAMLARGYNGEPPLYKPQPLNQDDKRVIAYGLVTILMLLGFGILTGRS